MLDMHRLEILHRFSVCGTISGAAVSLGYSPSAISQQLSTLEREAGTLLLERTARSAALTDAGRLLVDHAERILAAQEQAEARLAALSQTISGRLVVNVIPNVAAKVAVVLAQVQRKHPGIEILMRETVAEPAIEAVKNHTSDIAVIDEWSPYPDEGRGTVARRPILTEPVMLAVPVSHPLSQHKGPLGRDELAAAVAEMTWLCAPEGHASRSANDRVLERAKAVPLRRWEFEGLITIAELVALDAGCALLPASVAATQPANLLHAIPLKPKTSRQVQALTRPTALDRPSIAVCIAAIKNHLDPAPRMQVSELDPEATVSRAKPL